MASLCPPDLSIIPDNKNILLPRVNTGQMLTMFWLQNYSTFVIRRLYDSKNHNDSLKFVAIYLNITANKSILKSRLDGFESKYEYV